MAIYAVKQQGSEQVRLVKAKTQAQAIGHVVRDTYKATALNTEQFCDYTEKGIKVEQAEANGQQDGAQG